MEVSIIISLRWHPLYLSTDIEGNVAVHVTKYGVSIYSNIFPHMYYVLSFRGSFELFFIFVNAAAITGYENLTRAVSHL